MAEGLQVRRKNLASRGSFSPCKHSAYKESDSSTRAALTSS
jgi:hypothetical protein